MSLSAREAIEILEQRGGEENRAIADLVRRLAGLEWRPTEREWAHLAKSYAVGIKRTFDSFQALYGRPGDSAALKRHRALEAVCKFADLSSTEVVGMLEKGKPPPARKLPPRPRTKRAP
jgi:hypothetical protein